MQLCTIELCLNGSPINTVIKAGVTPAEILVLQQIHGDDAVRHVRPGKIDRNRRHASEYQRLSELYDRASAFSSKPGEESKSIMEKLFPGIVRKLPTTLKEIGLGYMVSPAAVEAAERAMNAKPDPAEAADPVPAPYEDDAAPADFLAAEDAYEASQADQPSEDPIQEDA